MAANGTLTPTAWMYLPYIIKVVTPMPAPTQTLSPTTTPTATSTPTATPTATSTATPTPTTSPSDSEGWHQEAHDAQHTGFVPWSVPTPWVFKWQWNGSCADGSDCRPGDPELGWSFEIPAKAHVTGGGGRLYLPAGERESVVRRRRRVRALFADTLRQGEREGSFSFAELDGDNAVEAASMAILNMAVWVADWFDPAGPRSAEETAALHGRLALRIASARG